MLFLMAGCSVAFLMTVTATKPLQPKPANCDFEIVGVPPASGYEEIATLSQSGGATTSDPSTFKEKIRADVCRVGGDLVVYRINGLGDFLGGSVMRKSDAGAASAAAAPAP